MFPSSERKRFVFIISRGDPEPPQMFPQFYDHLDEWLHLIPFSLGAEKFEFFHQHGAELDRKAARNDAQLLKKAKAAGAGLVAD